MPYVAILFHFEQAAELGIPPDSTYLTFPVGSLFQKQLDPEGRASVLAASDFLDLSEKIM